MAISRHQRNRRSWGGDDIFWGWLNSSGQIAITVGNQNSYPNSATSINDGNYHHIVLTRSHTTHEFKVYVDGALSRSGTFSGDGVQGTIGNAFSSIGRIEDTGGSPVYLDALVDELVIFDQILSDAEVQQIFEYQKLYQSFLFPDQIFWISFLREKS